MVFYNCTKRRHNNIIGKSNNANKRRTRSTTTAATKCNSDDSRTSSSLAYQFIDKSRLSEGKRGLLCCGNSSVSGSSDDDEMMTNKRPCLWWTVTYVVRCNRRYSLPIELQQAGDTIIFLTCAIGFSFEGFQRTGFPQFCKFWIIRSFLIICVCNTYYINIIEIVIQRRDIKGYAFDWLYGM